MLDTDIVNSTLLARWQVQVLGLDEPLVQQRLLDILLVELLLLRVLKQVLKQVLHHAVFNALTVECVLLLLIGGSTDLKYFHELLGHFRHQVLNQLALLLSGTIFFYKLGQCTPDKCFDRFAYRCCLRTLQLLIKRVKDTLGITSCTWITTNKWFRINFHFFDLFFLSNP